MGAGQNTLNYNNKDANWKYWIEQMKDPEKARSIRHQQQDNKNFTFGLDGIYRRKVQKKAGEGFYKGTQKTSTSLVHSSGRVKNYFGQPIGLLFNAAKCELRDQYCFDGDGNTLLPRWWKQSFQQGYDDAEWIIEFKNEISDHNRKFFEIFQQKPFSQLQKEAIESPPKQHYTEILASVKKEAVLGIYVIKEEQEAHIVEAMTKQKYLAEELGIFVPIYILSKSEPAKLFSLEEEKELAEARKLDDLSSFLGSIDQPLQPEEKTTDSAVTLPVPRLQKSIVDKQPKNNELLLSLPGTANQHAIVGIKHQGLIKTIRYWTEQLSRDIMYLEEFPNKRLLCEDYVKILTAIQDNHLDKNSSIGDVEDVWLEASKQIERFHGKNKKNSSSLQQAPSRQPGFFHNPHTPHQEGMPAQRIPLTQTKTSSNRCYLEKSPKVQKNHP